jgi:acyl-[acyl-carrier-protein]-phospholipid O-acyltransferase / long-chain-fatty-acid--[acyl-carrier-protein] ligase
MAQSPPAQPTTLFSQVIASCRARSKKIKIADSTGASLSGIDVLVRALVLRRVLRRDILSPDESSVALLLPPSAGGVVANLALALDQRVTVNLNYTLRAETLDGCLAAAGARHVLTSRAFLERVPYELKNAEFVYLEDLRDRVTARDKALSFAEGRLLPEHLLLRHLGLEAVPEDRLFTTIFTSGTTGRPKGVMLSYGNITSNLEGVDHVVHWTADDVVIGVLPFFHSFGSTVTLWAVMTRDVTGVYHTNPLDGQVVGRLTQEWSGTILPATPMFLRTYMHRCTPEEFKTLAVVAVGAERLPPALAEEFTEKYGVEPIQGYGCTEMSPLISANVPVNRARVDPEQWNDPQTVGRPVPGVLTRVVDPETGEPLPAGTPGLLLVDGPNRMLGYLDDPEATSAAMRDGWYVTGDIAAVDERGFIALRDRQSRFAKIAGEMVPFGALEEALLAIIGSDESGGPRAVVTAIPDERRGERLIVVHTPLDRTPAEIFDELAGQNLPRLYLPDRESFVEVPALPAIGAGKLDLHAIREVARQAFPASARH